MEPTEEELETLTREAVVVQERTIKSAIHQLFKLIDEVAGEESEAQKEKIAKRLASRQKWLWRHTSPNSLLVSKRENQFRQSAISIFYFVSAAIVRQEPTLARIQSSSSVF